MKMKILCIKCRNKQNCIKAMSVSHTLTMSFQMYGIVKISVDIFSRWVYVTSCRYFLFIQQQIKNMVNKRAINTHRERQREKKSEGKNEINA